MLSKSLDECLVWFTRWQGQNVGIWLGNVFLFLFFSFPLVLSIISNLKLHFLRREYFESEFPFSSTCFLSPVFIHDVERCNYNTIMRRPLPTYQNSKFSGCVFRVWNTAIYCCCATKVQNLLLDTTLQKNTCILWVPFYP